MKSEPKNPKVPTMRANLMKTFGRCQPHGPGAGKLDRRRAGADRAGRGPAAGHDGPAKPVFAIRGFDITGDNPLPGSETTRILAPFLRADATMDTLQKATAALEAALKARGLRPAPGGAATAVGGRRGASCRSSSSWSARSRSRA
jgi:hypothetical protein